MTDRRVYIACLESYNAGSLVGGWIDLDLVQDAEDLETQAKALIRGEEWAIHDHEGFLGAKVGEHSNLAEVWELHEQIVDAVESTSEEAVRAAIALFDADRWYEAIDNGAYRGSYNTLAEYAETLAEETGAELGSYARFIDWEAVAREEEISGEINSIRIAGEVHVFSSNW
jgi:antirestriction protein